MPQIGVISEPAYVVGMARIGSGDSSAIALPRPVVEPPPIATAQSAPTRAASSRAARATSIGTCITARANTPAHRSPSRFATSSACAACSGVASTSARLRAEPLDLARQLVESAPAPNTTRPGSWL